MNRWSACFPNKLCEARPAPPGMAARHGRIDAIQGDEEGSSKKSFEGSEQVENNQGQRSPAASPSSAVAAAASPPSFSAFLAGKRYHRLIHRLALTCRPTHVIASSKTRHGETTLMLTL